MIAHVNQLSRRSVCFITFYVRMSTAFTLPAGQMCRIAGSAGGKEVMCMLYYV